MSVDSEEPESRLLAQEASAAVRELAFAVDSVSISDKLRHDDQLIYINITTCEHASYCVELTVRGWRVVSKHHDKVEETPDEDQLSTIYFETIYQLLDSISPAYRQKFADKLIAELSKAKNDRSNETEEKV